MESYILSGKRTALGQFMGGLSQVSAPELGGHAIGATLKDHPELIEQVQGVYMGNVLSAGIGQAPARQAGFAGGLNKNVPAVTVNKVCGSGLYATVMGAMNIQLGEQNLVVCGGMENMSLVPHVMNMRVGQKFGAVSMKDSLEHDGLWDIYSQRSMGQCAQECSREAGFTREELDAWAIGSFKKSQEAQRKGDFQREIVSVEITQKKGKIIFQEDEGPGKALFEKIPTLPGAFEKNGTLTAANSSTLNDGAAAILIGNQDYKSYAKFKIRSFASHAHDPTRFATAPIGAMEKALKKAKLSFSDIGLFEINEAFASVVLHAVKDCKLDPDKINIFGGAISLGHPLGASGARILVTLMNAMETKKVSLGMATLCIGGGEGISMIIEKM
jgi:acetyl-CoA C-acetyltransferase